MPHEDGVHFIIRKADIDGKCKKDSKGKNNPKPKLLTLNPKP